MRRISAAAVVAATLAVTPVDARADVFNGRIGFTSFRDGDGEIFTMTSRGADLRQLTHNASTDAQGDWAPDGSAIAWRIQPPDRLFQVARMDPFGGQYEQLTRTGPTGREQSSQPSWFPNGGGLLFRRSGTRIQAAVWRMGTHGESPEQVLTAPGRQFYPSFAPDMSRIMFAMVLSEPVDVDRGVVTTDPAGGNLTVLFDTKDIFDSAPAWSPDGTRVAFESDANPVGENPEGDREIFVMRTDGTDVRQLTRNSAHDEGPAWSPDATMLAYTSGPDNTHGDIHVMSSADGTYLRQLTADAAADESPDWQTIPAPDTDRRCGDLEDAVDVRAAGRRLSCHRALRLVRAWLTGQRRVLRHYDATVDDFGGTKRVQLIRDHHGRDRKNGRDREKLVVFLVEPR